MNSLIFKTLLLLTTLLSASMLTSCSKEIDAPDMPDITDIKISYEVNLSDAYYDFFDIIVGYIDYDGNYTTTHITENWSKNFTVKKSKAGIFRISVTASPKDTPATGIDGESYTFEHDVYMSIIGVYEGGGIGPTLYSRASRGIKHIYYPFGNFGSTSSTIASLSSDNNS